MYVFFIFIGEICKADIQSTQIKAPEKSKYQCDESDFITTNSEYLKHHRKVKDIGIRYPCHQCEYSATKPNYLKKHK